MRVVLVILILIGGCRENKELSRSNIERWIKKNKLESYIEEIQTKDKLNKLIMFLTEEEKEKYLESTAKKEQELRFPRPTPMTEEYLDSITNQYVMDDAKQYRDEVDFNLNDIDINERLILIEDNNFRLKGDSVIVLRDFNNTFTKCNIDENCKKFIRTNFYNSIYHDPIQNKYYFGKTIHTNNINYQFPDTNEIILGTPESIIYITNLSPSERLYLMYILILSKH